MNNFYTLLEITEGASSSEIKAAFKRLALKYHPDKHKGDVVMEERFKEINEAYQVLSNPYEKARYDIRLKYGRTSIYPEQPKSEGYSYQSYSPPPKRSRPHFRRPGYSGPEIDWKENWKATVYALGFTLAVACLVMGGIKLKTYFDEKAFEEKVAMRRAVFNEAKSEYKMGNVAPALEKINALGIFLEVEEDMQRYKKELFESFIYNGTHNFSIGYYHKAIYYFELIESYADRQSLEIKLQLAESYRFTEQPYESLKVFTELLIAGQNSIDIYIQMAEIYRDQLGNMEESKRYYEIANDRAIETYEAIYGKAYPFLLNGRLLPELHYYLYVGLADIYLKNDMPERAIKATVWNINVWPDSAANYYTAAKGYDILGNIDLACENYYIAKLLGHQASIPSLCR